MIQVLEQKPGRDPPQFKLRGGETRLIQPEGKAALGSKAP